MKSIRLAIVGDIHGYWNKYDVNILQEMMIDKDCFGKNPIQAVTLENTIPFLDIGIPSSYNASQTYIPKLLNEMKYNG